MTLADFLLARIAEDEAAAHYATTRDGVDDRAPGGWGGWWLGHYQHYHRWDPDRILAECEAKRRIVELHERAEMFEPKCVQCLNSVWSDPVNEDWPCSTLLALALPYADHPGYRDEWRP